MIEVKVEKGVTVGIKGDLVVEEEEVVGDLLTLLIKQKNLEQLSILEKIK